MVSPERSIGPATATATAAAAAAAAAAAGVDASTDAVGTASATLAVVPNFRPVPRTIIYPGSFNPLHHGHVELAQFAQDKLGSGGQSRPAVIFEISAANADKPPLSLDTVNSRLQQFAQRGLPAVVTRAPLFVQKARLFPGSVFVIGADTARRIVNKKYYGNDELEMTTALSEIKDQGCSFFVGGRMDGNEFITVDHILQHQNLPQSIVAMFDGPRSPDEFRVDVSSTELRAKGQSVQ